MGDELVFVYGILTEAHAQKEKIGRKVEGIPDALSGYVESEVVIAGEIFPILEPGRQYIDGLVLSLTPEELEKVDEFETDAYKRIKVELESGTEAWVYVKNG